LAAFADLGRRPQQPFHPPVGVGAVELAAAELPERAVADDQLDLLVVVALGGHVADDREVDGVAAVVLPVSGRLLAGLVRRPQLGVRVEDLDRAVGQLGSVDLDLGLDHLGAHRPAGHPGRVGGGGLGHVREVVGATGQPLARDREVASPSRVPRVEPDLGRVVVAPLGLLGDGGARRGDLLDRDLDRPRGVAEQLDAGARRADLAVGAPAGDLLLRPGLDLAGDLRAAEVEVLADQPRAVAEVAEHDADAVEPVAARGGQRHAGDAPGRGVGRAGVPPGHGVDRDLSGHPVARLPELLPPHPPREVGQRHQRHWHGADPGLQSPGVEAIFVRSRHEFLPETQRLTAAYPFARGRPFSLSGRERPFGLEPDQRVLGEEGAPPEPDRRREPARLHPPP
jgi:hypothetical protein